MKTFSLVVLLIVFCQCGSKPTATGSNSEPTIAKGFHKVFIKSIKADFVFPDNYKKHDVYAVVELLQDSSQELENRDILHAILGMFRKEPKLELLLEESNPLDQIVFKPEAYFKPSSLTSGYGLGIIKSRLEQAFGPIGAQVIVEDSKMFRSPSKQILKGRFKVENLFYSFYWTQYLVTTDKRTFSILVVNDVGLDFEKEIKAMGIY